MNRTDSYTCEEAFRRIHDYVDRELAPEEMTLVREHLEICVTCAEEFEFEASILQNLRHRLQHITLPEDLRQRVEAALAAQS